MIVSFRHKGLRLLYETGSTKGVNAAHKAKLVSILAALDVATKPDELMLPSYRTHPLKGEMKGYWAIWVNGNWRVTFRFVGIDVELVDYQDYH
jgi:toxin HigB-1